VSNVVAWYPVHRSVYSAPVNLVFGEMGVGCSACVRESAHINSNINKPG